MLVGDPVEQGSLFHKAGFDKFEVLPLVIDGRQGLNGITNQKGMGEVAEEGLVPHVFDMVGELLHEHRVA